MNANQDSIESTNTKSVLSRWGSVMSFVAWVVFSFSFLGFLKQEYVESIVLFSVAAAIAVAVWRVPLFQRSLETDR